MADINTEKPQDETPEKQYLRIRYHVEVIFFVEVDEDHYPGMTAEQAAEYEINLPQGEVIEAIVGTLETQEGVQVKRNVVIFPEHLKKMHDDTTAILEQTRHNE